MPIYSTDHRGTSLPACAGEFPPPVATLRITRGKLYGSTSGGEMGPTEAFCTRCEKPIEPTREMAVVWTKKKDKEPLCMRQRRQHTTWNSTRLPKTESKGCTKNVRCFCRGPQHQTHHFHRRTKSHISKVMF